MNTKRLSQNIVALILVLFVIAVFVVYKPSTQKVEQKQITKKVAKDTLVFKGKTIRVDLNHATIEELCTIGFTKKQAYNCINYRKAGFIFNKVEDLRSLYTITNDDFERLAPYLYVLQSDNKKERSDSVVINKTVEQIIKIELNNCDTTVLKTIPKIASFRAKKIIEMRDKLGGYYSISQLLIVYSIDSSVYKEISKRCVVTQELIKKIDINIANWKELNAHPLINSYQAKNIIEYKKIVGTIKRVEELRDNNVLSNEEFAILKHYIKTF